MHYCIAIITEKFPTDDVLEKVLAPFNSESFYENCKEDEEPAEYPQFTWDWWQVGGRYDGLLKLKIDRENEEYRWDFYEKEPRAGRLYRSKLCENHLNKKRFLWGPVCKRRRLLPLHGDARWIHPS